MKLRINESMKYRKEWFFGGDKADKSLGIKDFVCAYIAENGERIEVVTKNNLTMYITDNNVFGHLKDAKDYIESNATN